MISDRLVNFWDVNMYLARFLILVFPIFCVPSISKLLAEEHRVNEYTIHYNIVNTSFFKPDVAVQYGFKRSKNIGLINIAVLKNSDTSAGEAIQSNIFGHGTSLAGRLKNLSFKEVNEGSAIYYIATFPINRGDTITFDLQVQPNKQGKLILLKFKKQLFID